MQLNTATANAEDILAALEDDSVQGLVVDEVYIKKLVSQVFYCNFLVVLWLCYYFQLEKKMLKNREMRIKNADDPKKFMDSEIELDTAIQVC